MPRDPQSLNWSELADALVRAAGLLPPGISDLEPNGRATLQVADFTDPEYYWLRRAGLYAGGGVIAAVAGQAGALEIRCVPGARDTLCVVEYIIAAASGATSFTACVQASILGAFTTGTIRDDRLTSRPSRVQLSAQAAAAILFTAGSPAYQAQSNFPVVIPGPWILTGNASLVVQAALANTQVSYWAVWRERPLQTLEQ